MSDINLLPEELRAAERAETAGTKPTTPAPRYTKAAKPAAGSMLGDRLHSLSSEEPRTGLWSRVKEWFMRPPAPTPLPKSQQVVVPPPRRATLSSAELAQVAEPVKLRPQAPTETVKPKPSAVQPSSTNIQPDTAEIASDADVPLGVVLDVNLLPADSRPVRVEDGNLQRLGLVLLAACLLVGIGYGILKTITVQRAHRVQALQQQATTLAQAIDKFRPALKVLQATSAKVLAIQQLLSHRPDWNELFNRIEDLTLTSVSYNSASITSDGDVVITVEATTVSDLARQLRVFESATSTFSSVTLGGISVGEATEGQVPLIQSTFQLKLAPAWAKAPQSSAGN